MNDHRVIVEYATITAWDGGELGREVRSYIKDGWQPWGHAMMQPSLRFGEPSYFVQPIVKYEGDKRLGGKDLEPIVRPLRKGE